MKSENEDTVSLGFHIDDRFAKDADSHGVAFADGFAVDQVRAGCGEFR